MRRYILFAAIACGMIFSACNRTHDTLLEEALEMAGKTARNWKRFWHTMPKTP